MTQDWEWQTQASCRGRSSEVFFGADNETGERRRRRESLAKQLCLDCPVVRRCRSYALAAQEPYGIWGALTPAERRRILDSGCEADIQVRATLLR
jgi:WhiB family redox-sensing transcriptional regulator